jgi:hypothetical protein
VISRASDAATTAGTEPTTATGVASVVRLPSTLERMMPPITSASVIAVEMMNAFDRT